MFPIQTQGAVNVCSLTLLTHQRLSHDDADLLLRHVGEVGEQTLEDVLARLAVRVDADGHHGWRTSFSLRTADWRYGRFIVSVPHWWCCKKKQKVIHLAQWHRRVCAKKVLQTKSQSTLTEYGNAILPQVCFFFHVASHDRAHMGMKTPWPTAGVFISYLRCHCL